MYGEISQTRRDFAWGVRSAFVVPRNAWCELRNDDRSFRPDRMEDVAMLDATFDGEDGVTLAAFLARTDSHFLGEETRGIKTPSLRR